MFVILSIDQYFVIIIISYLFDATFNVASVLWLTASDKYLKPITTNGVHLSPTQAPALAGEVTVRKMVAMYDYDPQELSPNVDAEVSVLVFVWV